MSKFNILERGLNEMNKNVFPFKQPEDDVLYEQGDVYFSNPNEDIGIFIRSYEQKGHLIASLHFIERTENDTYQLRDQIDSLIFPDDTQRQHFIDTFGEISIVEYYSKWAFGEKMKL